MSDKVSIKTLNGYSLEDTQARQEILELSEEKMDKTQGADKAEMLMYVDAAGNASHASLGDGLKLSKIAGKNIVFGEWEPGGYDKDGVWKSAGENSPNVGIKERFPVTPGDTYTVSCSRLLTTATFSTMYVVQYDEEGNHISNINYVFSPSSVIYATFTVDVATHYISIYFYGEGGTDYRSYLPENVMIEKGSVATEYEPYCPSGISLEVDRYKDKMSETDYTKEIATSVIDDALFKNAIISNTGGKYSELATGKSYAACKEFIPVIPGTEYTFKFTTNKVGLALYVDFYAGKNEDARISRAVNYYGQTYDGVIEFTTPETASYVRFLFYGEGEDYVNVKPSNMLLYVTGTKPVQANTRVIIPERLDIAGIHEKMVSEGFVDGDMSVPAYYNTDSYLGAKVTRIRELLDGCAGNGDAFMFVTDQHWELNAQQSPALMNHIARRVHIPRIFSGGDTADGIHEQYANALSAAFDGDIHHCSGNHDWFGTMDGNKLAYIWDVGKREQIGNAKRHYYYVDNPQQSIRYIVLCSFSNETGSLVTAYDTEQIEWLRDVALNVEEGWTVLVITHSLYYGFGEEATFVPSPEGASSIIEVLDAATCDVACVLSGHAHLDRICHTPGGIPVVVTTCDKYSPWIDGETNMEPWMETRVKGTITEQAFDVVVLDKAQRQLTFVRIGAPADNWTDGTSTGTVEERVVTY